MGDDFRSGLVAGTKKSVPGLSSGEPFGVPAFGDLCVTSFYLDLKD